MDAALNGKPGVHTATEVDDMYSYEYEDKPVEHPKVVLDHTAFVVAAILASGIAAGRKEITTPHQAWSDYRGVLSYIRQTGLEP